jgi:hypothetical protein
MKVSDRGKAFLLALVSTVFSLLIGIWVVAYWTVWPVANVARGDNLVEYDPGIGMVANRNAHTHLTYLDMGPRRHFEYDVYTDDRGARVDGAGHKSPPKVEILSVGDSFTWGHGLQNEDSYTSHVASLLGASASNLALAAYGTTQSLQVLERNLDLGPKLVIYGVIAHHFWRNVSPCAPSDYRFCMDVSHVDWNAAGRPYIAPPFSNGVRRLEMHVHGNFVNPARWLEHGGDVVFSRAYQAWGSLREPDDARKDEAMAFLLREMLRTTRKKNAKLLVVFLTTAFFDAPPSLPGIIRALGSDVHYLDTTEAFRRQRDTGGPSPYILGDGHPNAIGHALIAQQIVDYVRRENLLDAPRSAGDTR